MWLQLRQAAVSFRTRCIFIAIKLCARILFLPSFMEMHLFFRGGLVSSCQIVYMSCYKAWCTHSFAHLWLSNRWRWEVSVFGAQKMSTAKTTSLLAKIKFGSERPSDRPSVRATAIFRVYCCVCCSLHAIRELVLNFGLGDRPLTNYLRLQKIHLHTYCLRLLVFRLVRCTFCCRAEISLHLFFRQPFRHRCLVTLTFVSFVCCES